jgi:hypothetical protein
LDKSGKNRLPNGKAVISSVKPEELLILISVADMLEGVRGARTMDNGTFVLSVESM